jgi:hypothetical protein
MSAGILIREERISLFHNKQALKKPERDIIFFPAF